MTLWLELAHQSHWHVFLLDERDEQRGFWEFTNTFHLNRTLEEISSYVTGIELIDFDRAKEKFISETSLEALHALTSHSETNAEGLSIFDTANAVANPPAYPHPLKAARFAGLIREAGSSHATCNV
jgi:hypothetical protein